MKALIKKIKQYKYKSKSFLILSDVLCIPNDDISWVDSTYASKTYSWDFSEIITEIIDYGEKYNNCYNLEN